MDLNWFEELFGFQEPDRKELLSSYEIIHQNFHCNETTGFLTNQINGRVFQMGIFSTPTVKELREEVKTFAKQFIELKSTPSKARGRGKERGRTRGKGKCRHRVMLEHIKINSILGLHSLYPSAVFQAASQFNCLEFASPHATPENGITFYVTDRTQGPACAMACAPGTLYRNYFVKVGRDGEIVKEEEEEEKEEGRKEVEEEMGRGQSQHRQLNTLNSLERRLDNKKALRGEGYWEIRNGYSFSKTSHLTALNERFSQEFSRNPALREEYVDLIRVGYQRDTEVIVSSDEQLLPPSASDGSGGRICVTQVYCSALSCGYSGISNGYWQSLAKIILDGMYEGTLLIGVIQMLRHALNPSSFPVPSDALSAYPSHVFLTFIGGGVFRNEMSWINEAISRACGRVNRLLVELFGPLSEEVDDEEEVSMVLEVKICHFRQINRSIAESIDDLYNREISSSP